MSKLEDGMIRQQVFLEGLKSSEVKNVEKEITSLFDIYVSRFQTLEPDEFSGLTKTKLNAILAELRKKAVALYSKYTLAFLDFLKKLTGIETTMTAVVIKNTALGFIRNPAMSFFDKAYKAKVWAKVQSSILPSTGVSLKQYLDDLGSSVITNIERSLQKAVANLSKFGEWYDSIRGTLGRTTDGIRKRIGGLYNRYVNNARGTVNTAIQHTSSQVQASVQSEFFNKYYWLSVIDSGTTEICKSRDGNLYTYGEGPVPPAHIGCRSRITPADGDVQKSPDNFVKWLKDQPDRFINKVLNKTDADKLRSGNLSNDDLGNYKPDKSLDLNAYKNSVSAIIA